METKDIRQTVVIRASAKAVFEALIDERKHSAFTGARAAIDPRPGGVFTGYDGYFNGRNLEILSGKLIVQAWRSRHWPKAHYSIASFKLTRLPGGKTRLSFTQIGVPAGDCKDKTKGWRTYYWSPLKRYLERRK